MSYVAPRAVEAAHRTMRATRRDPDRWFAWGVDQAWNDKDSGIFFIGTYAAERSRRGEETNWQVTNLPNASEAFVLQDGAELPVEVAGPNSIRVRTTVDDHRYQIHTGYHGQPTAASRESVPARFAGGRGLRCPDPHCGRQRQSCGERPCRSRRRFQPRAGAPIPLGDP